MAIHVTLNTGARIPLVGLGTYKAGPGIGGDKGAATVKVLRPPNPSFVQARLMHAAVPILTVFLDMGAHLFVNLLWQAGYRHIDCASLYKNEKEVVSNPTSLTC
jgi:alcohol dehydrogenase (NADP+)